MRNAINKDFFREIKYTLNRYVSILLIVALGVAFLAGIRATCPDMKLTLDHYLDEADYMDLRVLSIGTDWGGSDGNCRSGWRKGSGWRT